MSTNKIRSDLEMVSYALEIQPNLLPYVTELLADLDELGSDAELIAEIIEELRLPPTSHIIDLGCGKGAVSFEVASELGFRVTGVDLFEPFIIACHTEAEKAGLSHQCRFVCGNIQHIAGDIESGDMAIMAALGDVMGPPDQTIAIIRKYVRPGGFMILSDGYLKDNTAERFAGFENYQTRENTLQALCSSGDVLIREIIEPADSSVDEDDEESNLILKRALSLASRHPELAGDFLEFAKSQREENSFLTRHFVSAIWLLQRS